MPYIPDIDGSSALNTISQYTEQVTGTAEQVGGKVVDMAGNQIQSTSSGGSTFFSSLKNITGTAGATVATLAGATVPTGAAVVAAAAAMALGAKLGEGWYDNNPEFWNGVGEKIYNLNPALSDDVYNGAHAVWTWVEGGKTYVDADVVQLVADELANANAFDEGSYSPPETGVVTNFLSSDALVQKVFSNIRTFFANTYPNKELYLPSVDEITSLLPSANMYAVYITMWHDQGLPDTTGHISTLHIISFNNPSVTVNNVSGDSTISYNIDWDTAYRTSYTPNWDYNTRSYNITATTTEQSSSSVYNLSYLPSYEGYANGSYSTAFPNAWSSSGSPNLPCYVGIGEFTQPYPIDGVTKQTGATTMPKNGSVETTFADWWANRQTRVKAWSVDPITGDIKIDETITTLPLEFPYNVPNPSALPTPEIDPDPDPNSKQWKRVQHQTENEPDPDADQDQDTRQEGDIKDDPVNDPLNDPFNDYKPAYEDLADKYTKDTGNEPETTPDPKPIGITPAITLPSGDAQALFTVYNPTKAQLDTFGGWLWSSNFLENLVKIIENPIDCVISLKKIFITPDTSGSGTIYCGHLASSASAALVSAQYKEINLGTINIGEYFYDATDYAPYTSVSCYLPFIGIVELSAYDCINATMGIKYTVDCYNGDFMANITLTKGSYSAVTYTYTGNCSVEYPITGSNHAALAVSAAVTAVTAVASGGLSLAGMAGMAGSLRGQQSVNGQMSGNAGACGCKTPYVIVKRTIPKPAANYSQYRGYGASKLMNIGNCSGYTRVKALITNNISGANDTEIQEIEDILKDGIIV